MSPDHHVWKRIRKLHHGGAVRSYCRSPVTEYGRNSPLPCDSCNKSNKKRRPNEPPQRATTDFLDQIDLMIQEKQDVYKS